MKIFLRTERLKVKTYLNGKKNVCRIKDFLRRRSSSSKQQSPTGLRITSLNFPQRKEAVAFGSDQPTADVSSIHGEGIKITIIPGLVLVVPLVVGRTEKDRFGNSVFPAILRNGKCNVEKSISSCLRRPRRRR